MDNLEAWRREFPILSRCVYMINNSLGAMPRRTAQNLAAYAEAWATRGVRAWEERWWEMPAEVGNLVGGIIGAARGTVSMHENVTTAHLVALPPPHRLHRDGFSIDDLSVPRAAGERLRAARRAGGRRPHGPHRSPARCHRRDHRGRRRFPRALPDVVHHGRGGDRGARARRRGG